jgi:hypothetical protein
VSGAIHSSRSRAWAAVAAVATPLAALGLVLATRDGPGIAGYVSESGVPGAPHSLLYRLTLLLLAFAAGAAAAGLRPVAGLAALAVSLAVPGLLVSGTVQCSAGCPLPPYEHPTRGDLLHAGASMAAVGLCALAMLAAALWSTDRGVRLGSRWAVAVMIPAGTAMLAGLLLVGKTPFTGAVERVCLAGCLAWVAGVSLLCARAPRKTGW